MLLGRITLYGRNLIVSAELLNARSNELLWGERYAREVSGLVIAQRQVLTPLPLPEVCQTRSIDDRDCFPIRRFDGGGQPLRCLIRPPDNVGRPGGTLRPN